MIEKLKIKAIGQFVVQDKVCPKSTTIPATTTTSTDSSGEVNPDMRKK